MKPPPCQLKRTLIYVDLYLYQTTFAHSMIKLTVYADLSDFRTQRQPIHPAHQLLFRQVGIIDCVWILIAILLDIDIVEIMNSVPLLLPLLLFICSEHILCKHPPSPSICAPCHCAPYNKPRFLNCQGHEATSFPDLNPETKRYLEKIYIFDSFISCLPNLSDPLEYPNLLELHEQMNLLWQCHCMDSWFNNLRDEVIIFTDCPHPTAPTTIQSNSTLRYTTNYVTTTGEEGVDSTPFLLPILIISVITLLAVFILTTHLLLTTPCRVKCLYCLRNHPTPGGGGGSGGGGGGGSSDTRSMNRFTRGGGLSPNRIDYMENEVDGGEIELWAVGASTTTSPTIEL